MDTCARITVSRPMNLANGRVVQRALSLTTRLPILVVFFPLITSYCMMPCRSEQRPKISMVTSAADLVSDCLSPEHSLEICRVAGTQRSAHKLLNRGYVTKSVADHEALYLLSHKKKTPSKSRLSRRRVFEQHDSS